MAISETAICNMALGRIGAQRINDFGTATSNEGIQCRLQYEATRDALLRSHAWRFALARAELSANSTTPAFEYDYQYDLPADCLRVVELYDSDSTFQLEGRRLLVNDETASIVYIRKVTDPTEFDSMFIKVLATALAVELVMPLTKGQPLRDRVAGELAQMLSGARLANLVETNTTGRDDMQTWNDARTEGAETNA